MKLVSISSLLLAASLLTAPAMANEQRGEDGQGIAVPIGGALRYDNEEVWGRLVELAGGKGARFAVIAAAAANPDKSADLIIRALNRHGAEASYIRIGPKLKDVDNKAAVRDPALINQIKSSDGVYFSGGDQSRITSVLLEADGKPTPLLKAIYEMQQSGGVVAGSSAGAAIMSETMFRDAEDVLTTMREGVRDGKELDRGLGFVKGGVFIDQHFLKRGRFGRMLRAMHAKGLKMGVGVDENTATIFRGDEVEVVGYKGALLIDLSEAVSDTKRKPFNLRNAKLTYLDHGDRYNLKTRTLIPSAEKLNGTRIDPNAKEFSPYFTKPAFFPDVLGDTTVVNLMSRLIDGKQREIIGLAFSLDRSDGFEFRFYKGKDSLGYFTGAFGGEDYTVSNVYLDVTPVRFAQPVYERRSD
ncbi:cyanophycinase [Chitinimonas sp. BJYL2]|uniref:cyanophycinase n=1 Tax=Chitinimonas sp. BJYL2 TaxID=2976696 RepID=UPI0022B4480E|nr:cyanophycinase [Chitinimonas sp. BJYL2]